MSRRKFLRRLGMSVAAIPLANQVAVTARPTKNNKPLIKLGVLVPDATRYPLLADNFLDGLRLSLNSDPGKHEIELYIESYHSNQGDLRQKAIKLAEYHQVDMMTGMMSGQNGHKIKSILEAREILFLENTIGESIPSKIPESACVFRNSFNMWSSSYASGTWAAEHLGKSCIVASSFYDSGFANVAAFHKGYQEAGGKVINMHITNIKEDDGYGDLFSEISNVKPDFVVGFYSGNEAVSFVHSYAHEKLSVPLLGAGLLCSDANLQVQASSANNIISLSTWTRKLNNKVNNSFVQKFETVHRKLADVYSMLGYESGQLFGTTLSMVNSYPSTDDMIKAFSGVSIQSPRGELSMHNHNLKGSVYLKKVTQENGLFVEKVYDQIARLDFDSRPIDELRNSIQSGWTNAYLT